MEDAKNNLQSCIDACMDCHQTCLQMAMTHCLQVGGKHLEPAHFTLMLNCAEICQTCANFLLGASDFAGRLCAACAEVCEACAISCDAVGEMEKCVAACRQCADACGEMADD